MEKRVNKNGIKLCTLQAFFIILKPAVCICKEHFFIFSLADEGHIAYFMTKEE